jgi:two-component sensor histidine kinase
MYAAVESVLDSHGGRDRVELDGPDLNLSAKAVLRLSLVLHELATNAAKYGALSKDAGSVRLTWRIEGADLTLRWQESGGPPLSKPSADGLGTRLIKSGMSGTGDGSVDYREGGLVAEFRAPLGQIENK